MKRLRLEFRLRAVQRGLRSLRRFPQEELPEQFGIIQTCGVALEERLARELGLHRVQILRVLDIHHRRHVIGAEAVDQDDFAFPRELLDQPVPVPRRPDPCGNRDQEPDERFATPAGKDREQRRLGFPEAGNRGGLASGGGFGSGNHGITSEVVSDRVALPCWRPRETAGRFHPLQRSDR